MCTITGNGLPWIMSHDLLSGRSHSLQNLAKWLNFELPGVILFAFSFFYNFAFHVFVIGASLFTPYLIFVLVREKRFGWILFFLILVVIPGGGSYWFFSGTENGTIAAGGMLAGGIPMALYLFYCYFLKLSLPGMLDE